MWLDRYLIKPFGHPLATLIGTKESTTCRLIWTSRAIMLVLAFYTVFQSRQYHLDVKGLPNAANFPGTRQAFLWAYIMGISLLTYLLASSALLWMRRGAMILLHGLMDLCLVCVIAEGYYRRWLSYVPDTVGRCDAFGEKDSFLLFMMSLKNDTAGAQQECRGVVSLSDILLGMLIVQSITTYIGLTFDPRPESLLNRWRPMRGLALVFLYAVVLIPAILFLLYFYLFYPHMHMTLAYITKYWRRLRMRPLDIPTPPNPQQPFTSYAIPATKLMDVLVIEEAVLEIVKCLCWKDVVNLGLACKAVREQVYPPLDLDYRIPKLKNASCEIATQRACFYCGIMICSTCKANKQIHTSSHGHHHTKHCQPHCRRCYKRRLVFGAVPASCRCVKPSIPNLIVHDVCQRCVDRFEKERRQWIECPEQQTLTMYEVQERRYQQSARDTATGIELGLRERLQCQGCANVIESNWLWWVCENCRRVCHHEIHPGYVLRLPVKDHSRDLERGESHT